MAKTLFFPGVTRGAELEAAINALEDGQVLLVENTRYEDVDGKKESKNDPELGKYWASLGDGIFVNDAFGTAHRAHASNVGISANVEKAVAGFLLETKSPTSKKQLKLQNVHSWLSLVVQKFQTRLVLSKTCLKKLTKSLSVVV